MAVFKPQTNKEMKICSKCNEKFRLEEHHFLPRVHYGKGIKNPHTITLCRFCHTKIETILMAVESFKGNVEFGNRFKLSKDDYMRIHRLWLRESKFLSLTFC